MKRGVRDDPHEKPEPGVHEFFVIVVSEAVLLQAISLGPLFLAAARETGPTPLILPLVLELGLLALGCLGFTEIHRRVHSNGLNLIFNI